MKKQKEIIEDLGKLNEVRIIETRRPDGSLRIQQDFSNCPSLAEQHTAHLTDINYLIKKYQPDELNAYLTQRAIYRTEILGHDFSLEPSLQDARNIVYRSKQEFENLSDDIKSQFKNHVEFLKFIDNPANAEKMLKLGILKKEQLDNMVIPTTEQNLENLNQNQSQTNLQNNQTNQTNQTQNPKT